MNHIYSTSDGVLSVVVLSAESAPRLRQRLRESAHASTMACFCDEARDLSIECRLLSSPQKDIRNQGSMNVLVTMLTARLSTECPDAVPAGSLGEASFTRSAHRSGHRHLAHCESTL